MSNNKLNNSPKLTSNSNSSSNQNIPQIPSQASNSISTSSLNSPKLLATSPKSLLNPNANPFLFVPSNNNNNNNNQQQNNNLNTNVNSSNSSVSDFRENTSSPNFTEQQKVDVIRKYLLSSEEQSVLNTTSSSPRSPSTQWDSNRIASTSSIIIGGSIEDEEFPTPYSLQGGDIVAPIYKWVQNQSAGPSNSGNGGELKRSKSLISLPEAKTRRVSSSIRGFENNSGFSTNLGGEQNDTFVDEEDELEEGSGMKVREILEPGGFRRDFVIRKMVSRAELENANSGNNYRRRGKNATRLTRSFIDFLSLYGHFGGEDLEEVEEGDEDEEEDEEESSEELYDEDNQIPAYRGGVSRNQEDENEISESPLSERTPLFSRQSKQNASTFTHPDHHHSHSHTRGSSVSRKRSSSVGQHGDATVTQAVLMLLKSFVGTGVLFLGKAFYNGGIVFSTIVLCGIAMISLYSFLLLVQTRLVVHGSFGDIGGILFGKYMRWAILFSIVLSQIGFVAAYTIFVSQNLQAFFMAVTKCATYIPIAYLILGQLVIFLPLAMIRNIQKLSGTALIADAFILFGLVYIFSNEIGVLIDNGLADVKAFNSKDFPLLIGTAVFSFEGIGLVIPITESMKDPHQFPRVLTGVMIGVMFLFAGAGALAYAAYGSAIQTVVFVNLPQDDKFVNAAQFLYSIAILLSTPLQLFPAVRIMENGIFSKSGKHSTKVKWEKNLFRMLVVSGGAFIAWAGASDLDKFVSLIGSVACVPLCFCYPALLHYKACAITRKQKLADIALFIFGCLAAVYTTAQTIKLLTNGEVSLPPSFGNCPPRA